MGRSKNKKKKFNGGFSRSTDPMKEILRITSLLNKIDVDKSVDDVVAKVTSTNNKIIESTSVQIANELLDKKTVIKEFTDNTYSIPSYVEDGPVQLVNKPFILGYLKDYGGCGHFRMIYPMNLINSRFSFTGKINCTFAPKMIVQNDIIPHVRAIVFQRPTGDMANYAVKTYKHYQPQYQYKLIAELDDYVFEVPKYNPLHDKNTVEETRSLLMNLSMMDEIMVSTDTLKEELIKLGLTNKITVMLNHLPKYLYQTDLKRYRLSNITKPRIIYNGTDSHYNNAKNMQGDFINNISEFIIKNIDNYEFIFFGNVPNFLKKYVELGKIIVVPVTNPVEYATMLRKTRADFVIAPLTENIFNSCKSDLKYLESSAIGAVFIGTKFIHGLNSPYQSNRVTFDENSTVEDIENIISKYKDKDIFNEELAIQYDDLDGRWLENNNNIFKYVEVFSNGIDGVTITEDHPQYSAINEHLKK